MAEQITVRILETDGKQYDVLLDEDSRELVTNASSSVPILKAEILAHASNTFTSAQAELIAIESVELMIQAGVIV